LQCQRAIHRSAKDFYQINKNSGKAKVSAISYLSKQLNIAGTYRCFPSSFHGNSDNYETTI
jgi:hypothetical protein